MPNKYEAILFDFDGVLIDSEPVHFRCWQQVLVPLGVPFDWETYRDHFIGIADREMAEAVSRLSGGRITAGEMMQLYPAKKALFRAEMKRSVPLAAGVRELLTDLAAYRLAVVSSSFRAEVEPVLEQAGLRGYFDVVVCGEDVGKHKPDPEPYLLAARTLRIGNALVVEDSAAGEASGLAAGFAVLRVGSAEEVADGVRMATGTTKLT